MTNDPLSIINLSQKSDPAHSDMILMNDFKGESEDSRVALVESVSRVIKSGWYVLGNEVKGFEREWARVCGVNHSVGVGNGMDAIEIAFRSLGIGAGDEVITSPMTAFATVLGIFRAGATPVLADIEPATGLLSANSVERCLSKRTRALLLVHLYGQIRAMDLWQDLCSRNGISLIEDCAQAHLASIDDKVAGSFGVAGAYSFYPTKNLGALGDAGMLVTNVPEVAEKAARIRNYGQTDRYHHSEFGLNSRLDEIQAAVLLERLKWLPKATERRQAIAAAYRAGICNSLVELLSEPEERSAHVYHLFVITCSQRDALQSYLSKFGIQTLIHYPVPVHLQGPCLDVKRDRVGLKNSERHADSCLSLPCHPQMDDNDVFKVIEAVNSFQPK